MANSSLHSVEERRDERGERRRRAEENKRREEKRGVVGISNQINKWKVYHQYQAVWYGTVLTMKYHR